MLVETWAFARLLAVAVMVQPERVNEQSMIFPEAIEIALASAAGCWAPPSKREICILPKPGPVPRSSPLYPRSLPPDAWKFLMPTPTPKLVASNAPNLCVQRIVHSSELISHGK